MPAKRGTDKQVLELRQGAIHPKGVLIAELHISERAVARRERDEEIRCGVCQQTFHGGSDFGIARAQLLAVVAEGTHKFHDPIAVRSLGEANCRVHRGAFNSTTARVVPNIVASRGRIRGNPTSRNDFKRFARA